MSQQQQQLQTVIQAIRNLFLTLSDAHFEAEVILERQRRRDSSKKTEASTAGADADEDENDDDNKISTRSKKRPAENDSSRSKKKGKQQKPKTTNEYSTMPGRELGKKFSLLNPGMSERIARTIDLKSQESIAKHGHFPFENKCGNLEIPLHVRAYSRSIYETLAKIRQFRNSSLEAQEFAWHYQDRLPKSECDFLKRRITLLEQEQKVLADEWKEARETPWKPPPPPPKPTAVAKSLLNKNQVAKAMVGLAASSMPTAATAAAPLKPNMQVQTALRVAARAQSAPRPALSPAPSAQTKAANPHHSIQPMTVHVYNGRRSHMDTGDDDPSSTNHASNNSQKLLPTSKKAANAHKMGEFANTIAQQYDTTVRNAETQLLRAFAKFNDSSYFNPQVHHDNQGDGSDCDDDGDARGKKQQNDHGDDIPAVRSVLMIFNQVPEQRPGGGAPAPFAKSSNNKESRKTGCPPKFTLVARDRKDLRATLTAFDAAFNILEHDNYFTEFIAAGETDKKLSSSVEQRLECVKQRRSRDALCSSRIQYRPSPPPLPPTTQE